MDPLKLDARYRSAALREAWFGAAFAVVCTILAILSALGLMDGPDYNSMLVAMTLIGIAVFLSGIAIIRWTRL
jgi:hypothetical protein